MTAIKRLGFLIYAALCMGIALSLATVFIVAEPKTAIPFAIAGTFFWLIGKTTSIGA